MLLLSIEPKIDWNGLLQTIESKNLVAIMFVSNSGFNHQKAIHLNVLSPVTSNVKEIMYSPFVVAQVQVDLAAVVEDVHLPVLVGGEGAGVDVDVRVDLDAETRSWRDARLT